MPVSFLEASRVSQLQRNLLFERHLLQLRHILVVNNLSFTVTPRSPVNDSSSERQLHVTWFPCGQCSLLALATKDLDHKRGSS